MMLQTGIVYYKCKPAPTYSVRLQPRALFLSLSLSRKATTSDSSMSVRRAHLAEYGGGSFEPIAGKERGSVEPPPREGAQGWGSRCLEGEFALRGTRTRAAWHEWRVSCRWDEERETRQAQRACASRSANRYTRVAAVVHAVCRLSGCACTCMADINVPRRHHHHHHHRHRHRRLASPSSDHRNGGAISTEAARSLIHRGGERSAARWVSK